MSSIESSSGASGSYSPRPRLSPGSERDLQWIANDAFDELSQALREGAQGDLSERVGAILVNAQLPASRVERTANELIGLKPIDAARCLDDLQIERELGAWEREGDFSEREQRHTVAEQLRGALRESLSRLYLHDLGISSLPNSLRHLTALRRLEIENCPRLQALPQLPLHTLQAIDVRGCPGIDSRICALRLPLKVEANPDAGLVDGETVIVEQERRRLVDELREWSARGSEEERFAREEIRVQMEELVAISWPPSLSQLNLEGSLISELPPGLDRLQGLKRLKLNFCANLAQLPPSIGRCWELEVIEAQECDKLASIPPEIGELQNLKVLDLTGSGIRSLPEELANCFRLRKLRLGNCRLLEQLPNGLAQMHMLRELECSFCSSLQRLPCPMEGLRKLETLNLRGCTNLQELPEDVGACRALRKIDLGDCKALKRLPSSFGALRSLRELDVEGSGMESVPPTVIWLNSNVALPLLRFQIKVPDGMNLPPRLPIAFEQSEAESQRSRMIQEVEGLSPEQRSALQWMLVLDWCINWLSVPMTGESFTNVESNGIEVDGIDPRELSHFFDSLPFGVRKWMERVFPHAERSGDEAGLPTEEQRAFILRLPDLPAVPRFIVTRSGGHEPELQQATWQRVLQEYCRTGGRIITHEWIPGALERWVQVGGAAEQADRQRVANLLLARQDDADRLSIRELTINSPTLTELPPDLALWPGLQTVDVSGCSSLQSLPELNQTNLRTLRCEGCTSLLNLDNLRGRLPSLRVLNLQNCSALQGFRRPDLQLPDLRVLDVRGCSAQTRLDAARLQSTIRQTRPNPPLVVLGPPERAGQARPEAVDQPGTAPTFEVTREQIKENPCAVLERLTDLIANGASTIFVKLDSGIDVGGLRRELWTLLGEQIFTDNAQDETRICATADHRSLQRPRGEGWVPLVRESRQDEDAANLQRLGVVMGWGQGRGLLIGPVLAPQCFSALSCAVREEPDQLVLAALSGDRYAPLLLQDGECSSEDLAALMALAELAVDGDVWQNRPDPASLKETQMWLRERSKAILDGLYPVGENGLRLTAVKSLLNGLVLGAEEAREMLVTNSPNELFKLYQGRVSANALLAALQLHPESDRDAKAETILEWLQNWVRDPLGRAAEPSDPVAREAEAERLRERFCQEVTGRAGIVEGEKLYLNVTQEGPPFYSHTCFLTLDVSKSFATEEAFRRALSLLLSADLEFNKG